MWPFRRKPEARSRDEPGIQTARLSRASTGTHGDYELADSEAVFAAVSRIANTFGCFPVHLFKEFEPQPDHPLERLLAYQPNHIMTPFQWRQTMEAYRNTEGNAYTLKVPSEDGMEVARLDVLDPTRVEPMVNRDTGEVWYSCRGDSGATFLVHGRQMIVTRHLCTNGYKGLRPADVLRGSLDYDAQIKKFSLDQVSTGVNSSVVLELPTQVGDEEAKNLIKRFLDAYRESNGSLIVLDGGAKATTFNRSPVDAKVLDVERITRNRVATVYNIPPHMLGDYADTSYSSMEQQMLEFFELTMIPIVTMYQDELNRKLLTWDEFRQGYRFRFDMEALLMADTAARAEADAKNVRNGLRTSDELRARDGRGPLPGGSQLMGSRDLAPLAYLVEHAAGSTEGTVNMG